MVALDNISALGRSTIVVMKGAILVCSMLLMIVIINFLGRDEILLVEVFGNDVLNVGG